jgi:hypothetical protein
MGIATPVGLILDGVVPVNGGMRTGNLILNGDMEEIEFVTPLWQPSLFTNGVVSTSAGAWTSYATSPFAGLFSVQATLTALKTDKPAYLYQEIPLNPGSQLDQLQLWHRVKYQQNCDAGLVSAAAKVRVSIDLVGSTGALTNLLTWICACNFGWLQCVREFRPSDYTTAAVMLDAVSLRVTLNVWPTTDVAGPVAYVARFDDLTLEAEAAFARNFSVGGTFPHRRDSVFERGSDRNRTMYQSSAGQGTAKRAGSIPFRLISEEQRDDLHGLWLYGARAPVTWYPVMASYPDSIAVIFDPEWPFTPENADLGILHRGTLGWQER